MYKEDSFVNDLLHFFYKFESFFVKMMKNETIVPWCIIINLEYFYQFVKFFFWIIYKKM